MPLSGHNAHEDVSVPETDLLTCGEEFACFELPYPPSVNAIYARNARGGVRLDDKAQKYRRDVYLLLNRHRYRLSGPVGLDLLFCPPDDRERDLDNLLKALLDAMQYAEVFTRDRQITDMRQRWRPKVKGGKVSVIVWWRREKAHA